jgi:uncharacterized protein (DUF1697 family)
VGVAVVLLRAANLGARNKVPMAELRRLVEEVGCTEVRTYVQSGNVVVRTSLSAEALRDGVRRAIRAEFGHDLAVVVRTAAQLRKVVDRNPFDARDPSKLLVAFLSGRPPAARVRDLLARDFGRDEARVAGTEVYGHYPGGYGRTKLSNAAIERILGVQATSRNWRTVTALLELTVSGTGPGR